MKPERALEALSLPVCVLDRTGLVQLSSSTWGAAARVGRQYESKGQVNYLRTLDHLAAQGDVHARLMRDGIASVIAGRAPQFRLEYPLDAQRTEWQLLHVDRMADGGVVLSHTDVTARRMAEARLRATLERYAAATAAGAVGVWDLDLATGMVSVDAVLDNLLGFTPVQPRSWAEWRAHVHADDLAAVDAIRHTSTRADAQRDEQGRMAFGPIEVRFADAHGGYRCMECRGHSVQDGSGRVTRVHGTAHDVTDRRAAQDALQRSNTHLQALARRLVEQEPPTEDIGA